MDNVDNVDNVDNMDNMDVDVDAGVDGPSGAKRKAEDALEDPRPPRRIKVNSPPASQLSGSAALIMGIL